MKNIDDKEREKNAKKLSFLTEQRLENFGLLIIFVI